MKMGCAQDSGHQTIRTGMCPKKGGFHSRDWILKFGYKPGSKSSTWGCLAHELFNRVPMEEIVVSIEIMQSKRDTVQQEKRQEELIDSLFEKLKGEPIADFYDRIAGCILVCDEGLQDLLIPRIVTALKDADIGLIPIAAISAALLQVTDNPELLIYWRQGHLKLPVQKQGLHALAMSSERAFASGLILIPIIELRNIHDKK